MYWRGAGVPPLTPVDVAVGSSVEDVISNVTVGSDTGRDSATPGGRTMKAAEVAENYEAPELSGKETTGRER